MNDKQQEPGLIKDLKNKNPCLWINSDYQPSKIVLPKLPLQKADILATSERLERFKPLLVKLFPELKSCDGLLESGISPLTCSSKRIF